MASEPAGGGSKTLTRGAWIPTTRNTTSADGGLKRCFRSHSAIAEERAWKKGYNRLVSRRDIRASAPDRIRPYG